MGAGIALVVIGTVLAFAVTDHLEDVNLPVVGLILMIAGAAVIANARRSSVEERKIVERGADGSEARVVDEVVKRNDRNDARGGGRY